MSKKSKKHKKLKPLDIKIISANEIEYYIRSKFEITNEDFWAWFFSECPFKETNLLCLDPGYHFPNEYKDYLRLIKDEFSESADEELRLEIENDF